MKSLQYAYPTSLLAEKLGEVRGCFYIIVDKKIVAKFPRNNRDLALEAFESINEPIDRFSSLTRERYYPGSNSKEN